MKQMTILDVDRVVDIHILAFQNFFLTSLGPPFLKELYRGFIKDESSINIIYLQEEKTLGFVCGSTHPSGFYSRLIKRRWWAFAVASIPAIVKDPLIIPRLLHAINKPSDVNIRRNFGTLMSIAVLPEYQEMGIGEKLVEGFLIDASKKRLEHVNLTTDKHDNEKVNRFYEKMGFSCIRSFITPEGREMNEYEIDL